MACCSKPGTAPRTCTTLKNVGLQNASKPCNLTNQGWAGMPFAVSGTRNCEAGCQEDTKTFWPAPKLIQNYNYVRYTCAGCDERDAPIDYRSKRQSSGK